jgi:histidinol-phosphate phosphatase family protein
VEFASSLGLGTSAAVLEGSFLASEEYCLIVMADCAMSLPLNGYLEELVSSDFDGLVLCRYSDHPSDSDTLLIGEDGLVEDLIPKGSKDYSATSGPLTSLSGVLFVRTEILRNLSGAGDFQSELFRMVSDRKLRVKAKVTRYFVRDTGTPERVQAVRAALVSGALKRRGAVSAAGVFIDRDGTLIPNTGDDRKTIEEGDISPNVIVELGNLNALGIPWFIVTNQPGVAKGKLSFQEVGSTFLQLQNLLSKSGVFFDDFRFCPHHPEKGWEGEVSELKFACKCRKPSSGMVDDLQSEHNLNLEASWLIGDSQSDEQLASGTGCQYIGITTDDSDALANAIRRAASEITNAS